MTVLSISPNQSSKDLEELDLSRSSCFTYRLKLNVTCKYIYNYVKYVHAYYTYWRRKWQPTPVLLPGKSDTTEWFTLTFIIHMGFPGGTSGKESICQSRRHKRPGLDPPAGKISGGGHGNPLQYSCLAYPMDREAWWATVHRFTQSQTQLKWLSTHIIHMFT